LRLRALRVPSRVGLSALRSRGLRVRLASPGKGSRVRVAVTVSKAVARKLHLGSRRTLATRTTTVRGGKAVVLRLRPTGAVRKRLARAAGHRAYRATVTVRVRAADGRTTTTKRTTKVQVGR
ncbi:hypothetical protein ACVU7I_02465, partial [Patulibacter sp. S7RM1-6]